jgi:type II secretory pathway predicted ATPase ExeA
MARPWAASLFLVTELLEGESLGSLMERNQRFTPSLTLHLMKQIASSLAEAHEIGIVHGDLKPDNVFVCETSPWSEPWFIKVLDFGLARLIGDANPAGLGTPQYMAPEQFAGEPLLPAADIYAAGLIIAELLLGARALGSPSTRLQSLLTGRTVTLPALPPLLESMGWGTVLRRALDPDPHARIPDGAALLSTLRALEVAAQHVGDQTWHGPPSVSSMAPEHHTLGWEGSASAQTAISSSTLRAISEADTIDGPLAALRARQDPQELNRLVGRATERAELRRALEALTDARRGELLVLCGERGSGKSLLSRWALAQARAMDLRCGESTCASDRCGLVAALGEALGVAQAPDGSYHMRALEDGAARRLRRELRPEETVTLMAAFGWYIERDQRRLLGGLLALLRALAQTSPLVLCLHNLERAIPQTLSALALLAEALEREPFPLLILTNVSRELLPEHPEVAQALLAISDRTSARNLHIQPLEEAAQSSLARAALGAALTLHGVQGEPGAALLGALTNAAHGNPLALQEIAQDLVARHLLTLTSNGLALRPGVEPQRLLPPALARFLEDRALARLAQPPRAARAPADAGAPLRAPWPQLPPGAPRGPPQARGALRAPLRPAAPGRPRHLAPAPRQGRPPRPRRRQHPRPLLALQPTADVARPATARRQPPRRRAAARHGRRRARDPLRQRRRPRPLPAPHHRTPRARHRAQRRRHARGLGAAPHLLAPHLNP